jgi:hypothetical protein
MTLTNKVRVESFWLNDPVDKDAYEVILNREDCTIIRDHLSHDKIGRTNITVWWEEDEEDL